MMHILELLPALPQKLSIYLRNRHARRHLTLACRHERRQPGPAIVRQQSGPGPGVGLLYPIDLMHRRSVTVEELQAFAQARTDLLPHPIAPGPVIEKYPDVDFTHCQPHRTRLAGGEVTERSEERRVGKGGR